MRDRLARQRTELANERTLLSYVRTALGFFIGCISAEWWIEGSGIQALGVVSLVTGLGIPRGRDSEILHFKEAINREPDLQGGNAWRKAGRAASRMALRKNGYSRER